jgi:hypothetical protein
MLNFILLINTTDMNNKFKTRIFIYTINGEYTLKPNNKRHLKEKLLWSLFWGFDSVLLNE